MNRFFRLQENGTNIRTELLAGLTTFLTMAYIIFLQPAVLSGRLLGRETGMDFGAVMTATCLAAALATALMGLWARLPIAQAPGMGENFFFVLTAIPVAAAAGHPEPWRAALGAVFVSGVLFLLLAVSGFRQKLIDAVSPGLKSSMAVGIGAMIAFIGLQNAGLIVKDPGTAVRLNPQLLSPDLLVFGVGLLTTGTLLARGVRGAVLWGIGTAAVAAMVLRGVAGWLPETWRGAAWWAESQLMTRFQWPTGIVAAPPSVSPTFLHMDLGAALSWSMLPVVVVFLFMDVFDTMGTLVGVTEAAGLSRDGQLPGGNRALLSDAAGTVVGAALGTSTVTSFIESAAGVEQGGRTGLTAVTTAVLFLLALFFSPLVAMVGSYPPLTAAALVAVGLLMMRGVTRIPWDDATEALPAFLIILGMPLTMSVGDGLALGLMAHPLLKLLAGRRREINWLMTGLALVLLAYFAFVRSRLG